MKDNGNVEACITIIRELTDAVDGARRAFINSYACVINRSYLIERLDRLTASLPEALTEAENIVREVQQVRAQTDRECNDQLSQAQAKAQQLVGEAQQTAQRMNAESQQNLQAAERNAQETIRRGQEEAQRMVRQAEQNAAAIRAQAEEECREKVSAENVYRIATVEAEELREKTNKEMAEYRQKSFDYLDSVLSQVDRYLGDMLSDVRMERKELNEHR